MKQYLNKKKILYLAISIYMIIEGFYLVKQEGIPWDSAVYIEMGKYIFSLGKVGLWEPARPIILPLILGLIWKIRLNPILFGKILEILSGLGCIYLTYSIGKRIFNENTGLLAALFLSLSPTFLFYSPTILTGIPSTFFTLLALDFFLKKKYFNSGSLLSLAFLTRYPQAFVLGCLASIIIVAHKKEKAKRVIDILSGFFIMSLPFIIINWLLYKNPLYPFLLQVFMTKNTGWIFNKPFYFYFVGLIKENLFNVFLIVGTMLILKRKEKKKAIEKILILFLFVVYFIFFSLIPHKEMRFTIVFLPYMYLISAYGTIKYIRLIAKRNKLFLYGFLLLTIFLWINLESANIYPPRYQQYKAFQAYIEKEEVKDNIWISNPIFIVNSNKKADELIYYTVYNSEKIKTLQKNLANAKHILVNTCDILPCHPKDKKCFNETKELLSTINKKFKLVYKNTSRDCQYFIFKKE